MMTISTNIFQKKRSTLIRGIGLLIILSLLVMAGCDTTDPHIEEENGHAEPVGFTLQIEGETLVSVPNSRDTEWNPDGTLNDWFRDSVTGLALSYNVINLRLDEDPTGLSQEIALRWIDDHGDLFDLDDPNDEYEIVWEWEKPNTLEETCSEETRTDPASLDQIRPANLTSVEGDHGGDEHAHEEVEVRFRADHAGSDRVRFLILHGEEGHADFTSAWIPVSVMDDDHPRIDENGIYQHSSDRCATY